MVKSATLITLLISAGATSANEKCRVIWEGTGSIPTSINNKYPLPTSNAPVTTYPVPTTKDITTYPTSSSVPPSSTTSSSTSSSSAPPTPNVDRDECLKLASQLQFVKGGKLNSAGNGINLDIGQAGAAQMSNNPFAKSLRKESVGFSLPLSAVPGKPIVTVTGLPPGSEINTEGYEINFINNAVGGGIYDVKCHYKKEDISGSSPSTTTASTTSTSSASVPPSPTPFPNQDSCLQIANQLNFVKGGKLNSAGDGVSLDIGQAGAAQMSNNPFAKSLRKESVGFSLPFAAVPGNPIKTATGLPPNTRIYTENYEINFIINAVGSGIQDVRCHYKEKDIGGSTDPTSSTTSSSPGPSPTPNTKKEQCENNAKELQFLKGTTLKDDFRTIFVDLGKAGEAKQSGSKFADSLRKVAGGFDFVMSTIPGNPFASANDAPASYTADYEINLKYNAEKTVTDVKCHYQSSDL